MSVTSSVQAQIMVPMPDGAHLAALLVRPQSSPAPVVLLRTPYGRMRHLEEGLGWAQQGFAFVAQDVRGRYESDGAWIPYTDERIDGAATLNWLAVQPWCDGRVIVVGGSYAGFAAWAAALSQHPAVCAAIIAVPAMGSHHTMFDPTGVLNLADHTWWWMTYADGRTERPRLFEAMQQIQPAILKHLPVIDIADRLWADLPGWRERLRHGPDAIPPYAITDEDLAQLTIPVLHLGGWHDPFIAHTLHQWLLAGSAITPRPQQTLLVGPWTHTLAFTSGTTIGEREYGATARLPLGRIQVQWLRQVLGDTVTPALPRVRIFIMGENRWQEPPTWPLLTAPRCLFAASDGRLIPTAEALGGTDMFTSDPANPFPARSLPVDQRDLAERPDAIRYTTAPLSTALTWAGTPTVTLYATTDAPGTDWVVRLHEILPNGRMLYLGHGLVDAVRACEGTFMPDCIHSYNIALKPQAITIPAGSCLGLEIASSAFPEHARNLQTGADRYTSVETRVASQSIHHGEPFPTCLVLPIMIEDGNDG